METKETTKRVPLIKRSTSYKIIIPAEVERIIRFLCERVWSTEWSGVLFYTPSGSFEDGSLEIRCVDILPMDIGSATYTEFNMSPDVISYMAQKPELLDCKMGLIHSHNNMSTFFSTTDTDTLQAEGADRNHFVSLIVNNAGNYTAAITRKIKYHSVRDLSYEGFDGTVKLDGKEEFEGEEIEYFNLDIVFEGERDNYFKDIADRLDEIKKSKAPKSPYGNWTPNSQSSQIPTTTNVYGKNWKQPTLFEEDEWGTVPKKNAEKSKEVTKPVTNKAVLVHEDGSLVSSADVEKAIIQLLTGSVTITSLDKDTKAKIIKTIDTRFGNRFGKNELGLKLFEYWATDFIEFILWYSSTGDVDECDFGVELADKLVDELEKLPQSDFIDKYIEILVSYAAKLS